MLEHTVLAILNEAISSYRDNQVASDWLQYQRQRFFEPLRITVAGARGTGKSTLVNALLGEKLAPIVAEDGTALSTWYRDGDTPRAGVYSPNAPARELPIIKTTRGPRVDVRQWRPHPLDRLVVDWPSRALRSAILIDPPGSLPITAPPSADNSESGQVSGDADAVLFLTKRMHGMDLDFLRPTPDQPISVAAPISTILVLSRADELGAGRIDALSSARQIARRHQGDAAVRAACQNVVAVSGMLAVAGRTMQENEFRMLYALANAPRAGTANFLLSVQRFLGPSFPVAIDVPTRHMLLDRFGIFGVRLATTLIRRGADSPPALAAQLVQRSGLTELRDSISQYFTDRLPVFKARSALVALAELARSQQHPYSARLAAGVERALANAHEFRELRLLAQLRSGQTILPAELDADAQRLIGGQGTSFAERLGLDERADETAIRRAILADLRIWQEQAENPPPGTATREAARIVVRSCEAMLAALPSVLSRN